MDTQEAEVAYLVELPFYDGWSVKVMTDGTMVNRWAGVLAEARRHNRLRGRDEIVLTRRAEAAQRWIDAQRKEKS